MKIEKLIDRGYPKLILCFNGWSAPLALFRQLAVPADADYRVVYDYHDSQFDTDLGTYAEVQVYAWSLGVWVASQVLLTLPHVRITKSVAINGTPSPLSATEGIPEVAFRATLHHLTLEGIRMELRGLIKFLIDGGPNVPLITSLSDPVLSRREGEAINPGEDFADYRLKVNRYLAEHGDMTVIHKLRSNLPMTSLEYEELERIFIEELGSEEDYRRTYGSTPFGLLVRKITKLDHGAAMEAFAELINDETLTQAQIAFVHRVVEYVENNGYMEPAVLAKAPFDRPVSFFRLFDDGRQKRLVQLINQVKANALSPVA